jgi:hypothetical protein
LNNSSRITLLWDGDQWQVESNIPTSRLIPGMQFEMSVTIPESGSSEETIFPEGTILYMLVDGEKDGDVISAISERHWRNRPFLSTRPQKHLVPIVLDEALRLRPSQKLFDCRCRIEDCPETFTSLNAAATFALERWTDRVTASVNVFSEVFFVHKKSLLRLKHRREELTRGTPLPVSETAEEDGDLFNRIRKPTPP